MDGWLWCGGSGGSVPEPILVHSLAVRTNSDKKDEKSNRKGYQNKRLMILKE